MRILCSLHLNGTNAYKMPPEHLPLPTGEHTVGSFDVMVGCGKDGSFFRLYYPSPKCDILEYKQRWPPWVDKVQYLDGYMNYINLNRRFGRILSHWVIGDVKIPVIWESPILRENNKPYPVVMFSHGLAANRTTYSYICADLASHGFVVASVEHRDQSASATYILNDAEQNTAKENPAATDNHKHGCTLKEKTQTTLREEWVPFYKLHKHHDNEFNVRNKQLEIRANEMIRACEILQKINKGEKIDNLLSPSFTTNQFEGLFDIAKGCGLMGHSFGAATVVKALATDERFRVGICLDAWMFPVEDEAYGKVTQPVLFINTEEFQWKANIIKEMKLCDNTKEERTLITIRGTVHQSQADFTLMVKGFVGRLFKTHGALDPIVAMEINNRSAMAFLWRYLDCATKESFWQLMSESHKHIILGTNVKLH